MCWALRRTWCGSTTRSGPLPARSAFQESRGACSPQCQRNRNEHARSSGPTFPPNRSGVHGKKQGNSRLHLFHGRHRENFARSRANHAPEEGATTRGCAPSRSRLCYGRASVTVAPLLRSRLCYGRASDGRWKSSRKRARHSCLAPGSRYSFPRTVFDCLGFNGPTRMQACMQLQGLWPCTER